MMVCIYCRTNLVNGKRYVGKAKDIKVREYTWKSTTPYAGRYINRAKAKYGIENFKLEILKDNINEEELDNWERYYIVKLNTKAPNGYNLTDGGDGLKGYKPTKETLRKKSIAMKGKNKGKHPTEESKQKNRIAHLGKKETQEQKDKISKSLKEYYKTHKSWRFGTGKKRIKLSEEELRCVRQKCAKYMQLANRKPILAYLLDGTFLKKYNSAKDAAIDLGLTLNGVCRCARGERNKYKEYTFKYDNNE